GSFILLILGAYKTLSDAFHDFDFKRILIFASGALVGIISFSHLLKWLFKHYHNTTLAILTVFILGSLNKVWPWKATVLVMEKATGTITPLSEISNLGTLAIYQQQLNDFESYKVVSEKSVWAFQYSEINNY